MFSSDSFWPTLKNTLLLFSLIPLCLLGGQAVERLWGALGEWKTHPLLWALVGAGCLVAFASLIQLVTYLANPSTPYLLRIAALAVFLLSLYALAWSLRGIAVPLRALVVLALVLLAVGGLRTMARVNYLTARDPLEPLVGSTVSPEVLDLARYACLLYTSPSPRDRTRPRMPSSA